MDGLREELDVTKSNSTPVKIVFSFSVMMITDLDPRLKQRKTRSVLLTARTQEVHGLPWMAACCLVSVVILQIGIFGSGALCTALRLVAFRKGKRLFASCSKY